MELIDEMKNRLRLAMTKRNIAQVYLCEKSGIEKTLLNKYIKEVVKAKQDKIYAYNISFFYNFISWLH